MYSCDDFIYNNGFKNILSLWNIQHIHTCTHVRGASRDCFKTVQRIRKRSRHKLIAAAGGSLQHFYFPVLHLLKVLKCFYKALPGVTNQNFGCLWRKLGTTWPPKRENVPAPMQVCWRCGNSLHMICASFWVHKAMQQVAFKKIERKHFSAQRP